MSDEGDPVVGPTIKEVTKVLQMTIHGQVIDQRRDLGQVVGHPRPAIQKNHRRPARRLTVRPRQQATDGTVAPLMRREGNLKRNSACLADSCSVAR